MGRGVDKLFLSSFFSSSEKLIGIYGEVTVVWISIEEKMKGKERSPLSGPRWIRRRSFAQQIVLEIFGSRADSPVGSYLELTENMSESFKLQSLCSSCK